MSFRKIRKAVYTTARTAITTSTPLTVPSFSIVRYPQLPKPKKIKAARTSPTNQSVRLSGASSSVLLVDIYTSLLWWLVPPVPYQAEKILQEENRLTTASLSSSLLFRSTGSFPGVRSFYGLRSSSIANPRGSHNIDSIT